MHEIDLTADELVSALLNLASTETVCLLDSCGSSNLGSHLLIAGIEPTDAIEITDDDPSTTLDTLDEIFAGDLASIFTISYDFGQKLLSIPPNTSSEAVREPDVYIARFDALIVHDYDTHVSFLVGSPQKCRHISARLRANLSNHKSDISNSAATVTSNFTKGKYLETIDTIKERIRSGDTYQTNLTQQLSASLPTDITPEIIFARLRRDHPAPFGAFIKRLDSTVVSASPERFFSIQKCGGPSLTNGLTSNYAKTRHRISTSPIKGTNPRGKTAIEDLNFQNELLNSQKDRAENTMIVDLLRNDLGRVCEYGSVEVEKLCDLEKHPTLFHLVSTINGQLRNKAKFSEILKALFPCGSITGAPKISTMQIISEIENADRGLSMGAIGIFVPTSNLKFQISNNASQSTSFLDLSVAIRTMVIRDQTAVFNVGGGIVIDSDPQSEYEETLIKAKALLDAIGASSEFQL